MNAINRKGFLRVSFVREKRKGFWFQLNKLRLQVICVNIIIEFDFAIKK
jgi:hypothetical protein